MVLLHVGEAGGDVEDDGELEAGASSMPSGIWGGWYVRSMVMVVVDGSPELDIVEEAVSTVSCVVNRVLSYRVS